MTRLPTTAAAANFAFIPPVLLLTNGQSAPFAAADKAFALLLRSHADANTTSLATSALEADKPNQDVLPDQWPTNSALAPVKPSSQSALLMTAFSHTLQQERFTATSRLPIADT